MAPASSMVTSTWRRCHRHGVRGLAEASMVVASTARRHRYWAPRPRNAQTTERWAILLAAGPRAPGAPDATRTRRSICAARAGRLGGLETAAVALAERARCVAYHAQRGEAILLRKIRRASPAQYITAKPSSARLRRRRRASAMRSKPHRDFGGKSSRRVSPSVDKRQAVRPRRSSGEMPKFRAHRDDARYICADETGATAGNAAA